MVRLTFAVAAACLATVAMVEVGTRGLVGTEVIDLARPHSDDELYWRSDHPTFGVWHAPNASWVHRSKCFKVKYTSNSVGARDIERSRRAAGPRVAVLGDSFFEGWGVVAHQRMSNRLEAITGVPHLNFAMAHFGPYQQLIAYETLVSDFDHDAVIASIVPINDFEDTDYDLARSTVGYRFMYRPYLVGDPPHLEHLDVRENAARRWLRQRSYAFNVVLPLIDQRRAGRFEDARAASIARVGDPPSRFYDYADAAALRLEIILAGLAKAVGERPLAVLLVPTRPDLLRFRSDGVSPLERRLVEAGARDGYSVVDLLPPMAERVTEVDRYFFPCDYHWNSFANEVAAEQVAEALGGTFFGGRARGAVRSEPAA